MRRYMTNWPHGVRQVDATLDENGSKVQFFYNHSIDNGTKHKHYYEYKVWKHKSVIFKYPSWESIGDKDKMLYIDADINYQLIHTIEVTFTLSSQILGFNVPPLMNGKLQPTVSDIDTHRYDLQCPKCSHNLDTIQYKEVDHATMVIPLHIKMLNYHEVIGSSCTDCDEYLNKTLGPGFCRCKKLTDFIDIKCKLCFRCERDERVIVKNEECKTSIYFSKCDLETFLDYYWNRLNPYFVGKCEKRNSYKRRDRSFTFSYPTTTQDIQKSLFSFGKGNKSNTCNRFHKMVNKKKHLENPDFPTLQQICILKLVLTSLEKQTADQYTFVRKLADFIVDETLRDEIELLYLFLHKRSLKKQNYILKDGLSKRPAKKFSIFDEKTEREHPIYKQYYKC